MVLLVHAYSFFVYFYLFTRTGLEGVDWSLSEAARSLGASRVRTFVSVILPAVRPHLFAAALVTFMVSMASFTAPYIFATKNLRVLSVEIQRAVVNGNADRAAVQCVILASICVGFLLLIRRLEGRRRYSAGKGAARRREAIGKQWIRRLLCGLGGMVVLAAAVPHLTIIYLSLVVQLGVDESLTFAHYRAVLGHP